MLRGEVALVDVEIAGSRVIGAFSWLCAGALAVAALAALLRASRPAARLALSR